MLYKAEVALRREDEMVQERYAESIRRVFKARGDIPVLDAWREAP